MYTKNISNLNRCSGNSDKLFPFSTVTMIRIAGLCFMGRTKRVKEEVQVKGENKTGA
jgi:hypothetical protein